MKPFNPDKDLWQWKGYPPPGNMWLGGYCYRVIPPKMTQHDIDMRIRAQEMQRGADLMYWGVIIALVCAVAHGCSSVKALGRIAEWGIVGGLLAVVSGLLYKKATQYENWIILLVVVAGGGFLLYRYRGWSLSHIFKKK